MVEASINSWAPHSIRSLNTHPISTHMNFEYVNFKLNFLWKCISMCHIHAFYKKSALYKYLHEGYVFKTNDKLVFSPCVFLDPDPDIINMPLGASSFRIKT